MVPYTTGKAPRFKMWLLLNELFWHHHGARKQSAEPLSLQGSGFPSLIPRPRTQGSPGTVPSFPHPHPYLQNPSEGMISACCVPGIVLNTSCNHFVNDCDTDDILWLRKGGLANKYRPGRSPKGNYVSFPPPPPPPASVWLYSSCLQPPMGANVS